MGGFEVRLITSNDNLRALRFYQRRGMRLVGVDGIPLHDELVLELRTGVEG